MKSHPAAKAAELLSNPRRLSALARYNLIGSPPEPAFDGIATLAAQICEAPIAFVSFLDAERQWFKARVGLPISEMSLDRAMCVHTLPSPGLTVIADLSKDPRTASMSYVAGSPHLRFYAGMRIDDPEELPLGTLCVLDLEPRPNGLTASQRSSLAALTMQVEAQLALHQATAERDRLAQLALQDKTLEFEALAENVSQLAWMADPDGAVYWFNRRWTSYTGRSLDASKGGAWIAIHHPDRMEEISVDIRMCWAAGVAWERVFELRAADGQYRPFLTRAEPIRDETGRVTRWFGTSTDISAQVDAENRLIQLNASLQGQIYAALQEQARTEDQLRQTHKMEAVGQLTGGLAHEFNNILASIGGNLELMQRRILQGRTQDLARYLDTARGGVDRAATLTHRLLAFSRRQILDPRLTELNARVAGMEGLIRHTLGPSIDLEVVAAEEPCLTHVDPDQLDNALLNLCLNARDAMPAGGRLSIETALATEDIVKAVQPGLPAGPHVSLTVTDTGTGMSPDVLSRVFDPFFTTKPLGEGTGLGLSMVYGFVGQSTGQIRIDSAVGRGTRICIFFPRHMAAQFPTTHSQVITSPPMAVKGRTVLLVEDEEEIRLLVAETLTELGCVVLQAVNGKDGIAILQSKQTVDLLITDIGLPGGIDGYQVADTAGRERSGLRVLFITGYDQTVVLGQDRDGERRVLTKPFTLADLVRCTQELVEQGELTIH